MNRPTGAAGAVTPLATPVFGPVAREVIRLQRADALPPISWRTYALLIESAMQTDASLSQEMDRHSE